MGKRGPRIRFGKTRLQIYLEYAGVRLLVGLLKLLGRRGAYALGWGVGRLLYAVDARHRRLALRQIADSFPDMPRAEVRRIARQAVDSAVLMGFETLIAPRYLNPANLQGIIEIPDPESFLPYMDNEGRGPILVTGHFGNWEVATYALAHMGFEGIVLARPLDNPLLNNYVKRLREVEKLRTVDKKGGVRHAMRAIRQGQFAGFIADQHAGRKGLMVEFFGRPASTVGSIAMLAHRLDAPVVVCSCRRLGRRFRFEFTAPAVITPDQWRDQADPIDWITREFTARLEDIVRSDPGQYFGWLHKRWRNAPATTAPRA